MSTHANVFYMHVTKMLLTHALTRARMRKQINTHNQTNANIHTHTHNPTPTLSAHLSINNQQSEALWSLWSCDLWPPELTPEKPVLRGEPGGSLKSSEVPMRLRTGEVQRSETLMMMIAMKGLKWTWMFWHDSRLVPCVYVQKATNVKYLCKCGFKSKV